MLHLPGWRLDQRRCCGRLSFSEQTAGSAARRARRRALRRSSHRFDLGVETVGRPGAGGRAAEGGEMTSPPTDYPANWPGARSEPAAPATPIEVLLLAVDMFIASLSDNEFRVLAERTRGR